MYMGWPVCSFVDQARCKAQLVEPLHSRFPVLEVTDAEDWSDIPDGASRGKGIVPAGILTLDVSFHFLLHVILNLRTNEQLWPSRDASINTFFSRSCSIL